MREQLFCQPSPLCLIKSLVKRQQPSASLQAVSSHFQLVHRVDILYVHLDTWAIRCLRGPHVEVFMSPCLEIYRVVAVVQVGEFGQEIEMVFRVQLRVWLFVPASAELE